ncbi:MAG: hypothetical protein HFF62_03990 [Oscillospiraceae bacterium]|nr:hypothetical protein [Oscillospiraceae bacterium]
MIAVNDELLRAAMEKTCDSIPPQQAIIVTVFVMGYSFEDEIQKQVYRAMVESDDFGRGSIALDAATAYCETHGIRWGTVRVISTTHYPKGHAEGHYVIEAIVRPRVDKEE